MAKQNLQYDYDFMSAQRIGRYGFKSAELKSLAQKLPEYNKKLKINQQQPKLSFELLPYEKKTVTQVKSLAKKLIGKFDNLVVVGIGGSDLGARAIYQALAGDFTGCLPPKAKALKLYFLGDTTDPQPLADLLQCLDLKKTVFYVISRSGNTTETLTNFLYLREQVIKKVGQKNQAKHFVITTNTDKGALLEIAVKEKYLLLPHHQVGGRFSVLSVNGLLPAACAGFSPEQFLAGARAIDKIAQSNNYKKNLPFVFAALHYLGDKKRGQNISVIMPYAYYLNEFGFWYRQLIAESLGEKKRVRGKATNIGITPIASSGPTDQHSQIQLYIDGPFNKIITFIKVAKSLDLKVPQYQNSQAAYLGGHKFQDILNIEHQATAVSLMKNQRANGTIILPELTEYYLGQLFYFMEMATYYLGEMLQVDIFDQPGVEQSKNYMHGLLGKPDYEKYKKEIKNI